MKDMMLRVLKLVLIGLAVTAIAFFTAGYKIAILSLLLYAVILSFGTLTKNIH